MSAAEQVSVAVVGGGPVGITIANLLGVYGVDALVLERSDEILQYPRAVGIDDETLRLWQSAGLASEIERDMIANVPLRMFSAGGACFADIRPATREFGWFRRNIFSQPVAEVALRRGLERFPRVRLQTGAEVTALTPAGPSVALNVRDAAGERTVLARYVVGADGGRSTMRELLGVPFDGTTHPRKWVVIECEDDPLDAPFTALHCDPRRPYVSLRLPYGLRRWEFILFPGEDDETVLRPEKVRELLGDHVADPAALRIVRARVYTHHSRVARTFRAGNVFLAGDAAHLSPPWIGQGLNAGLRDAGNLAWKLAAVTSGRFGERLLDTYQSERHAHAAAMIALADQVGSVFAVRNRALTALRDGLLLAIRGVPAIRDYVVQMKFKPMPAYGDGAFVARKRAEVRAGRMVPQPLVECEGHRVRFDDACGPWFAIAGWQCDPRAHMPDADLAFWQAAGARFVTVVRSRDARIPASDPAAGYFTVQDVENVLSYWFEEAGADVAVIRPDRYAAVCCPAGAFAERLATLREAFAPRALPEAVPA